MITRLDGREAFRIVRQWSGAILVSAAMLIIALFGVTLAQAHDHWVSKGGYKNAAGEWCCGSYDCKAHEATFSTALGWIIETGEIVPYDEGILDKNGKAVIPPDGSVTVCRRPDGSRRCAFGRKPGF